MKLFHSFVTLHLSGYSVVRSLSEAPNYASAIANILKQRRDKNMLITTGITENISIQGTWKVNNILPLSLSRFTGSCV